MKLIVCFVFAVLLAMTMAYKQTILSRSMTTMRSTRMQQLSMHAKDNHFLKSLKKIATAGFLYGSFMNVASPVFADETATTTTTTTTTPKTASGGNTFIEKVPLYTKRSSDVVQYADVSRGFRLLRPFGYNEFDGAGGGYVVKFASLFDVDENVVVGSTAASADKTSITDYGTLDQIGNKLAAKRNGKVVEAKARETEGIVFYSYEFENPVDESLPRPRNTKPTKIIEFYELCVAKGRLWSIQATTNDKLLPQHEKTLRIAIDSFIPRL